MTIGITLRDLHRPNPRVYGGPSCSQIYEPEIDPSSDDIIAKHARIRGH